MNAYEYLTALRAALAVLPAEEIDSAMHYYEEYFLEAGDENAGRIIAELGSPEQVAQDILNAYTGMTRTARHAHADAADDAPLAGTVVDEKPRRAMSPWLLAVLIVLAIPVAVIVLGIAIAVAATVFALAVAALALCAALPFGLCVVGGGLCVLALVVLFLSPASALLTLGVGLMCAAAGVLIGLLLVKLAMRLVPPAVRGLVAALRWPLERMRGALR